ncbi:MAG: cytochrome b5 domain-containing protein [Tissierellia bacterium]|nr:cytochrome b5 domain-containing protein [Tissierellia bacterium]
MATDTTKEQEFTLEELKTYNGRDGNRAYVAVDGIVYDLTDSSLWKDGRHNGFEAGADLTTAIKEESPHGVSKLTGMPVVGKLVE